MVHAQIGEQLLCLRPGEGARNAPRHPADHKEVDLGEATKLPGDGQGQCVNVTFGLLKFRRIAAQLGEVWPCRYEAPVG